MVSRWDDLVGNAQDPRKLVGLALVAQRSGLRDKAVSLARLALSRSPGDAEIRALASGILSAGVPNWHFDIVRDDARNRAFEQALANCVTPEARVLDIGAGTGLLAMMAARLGCRDVVTCESDPAIAAAAADVIAHNGYAGQVRVIAQRSTDLDAAALDGRADVVVAEVVASNMLSEGILSVARDAVARLLKPGGRFIPARGTIRVALAYREGSPSGLGTVEGFDLSPFNALRPALRPLSAGDARLQLRSAPGDLFHFAFAVDPPSEGEAEIALAAENGVVNGIVQWIHLDLDDAVTYENRPEPGTASN
ncbi:MAG: 50S ribosomal protein L11 methyltransferase, partial [Sphingomonas sp.]